MRVRIDESRKNTSARPVDDGDAALAHDAETAAGLQLDGGILIDADAEHAGVLRDDCQQTIDPATLGEVLVDDHVAREAEAGSEAQVVFDAMRAARRPTNHHRLAHHRCTSGRTGYHPAA